VVSRERTAVLDEVSKAIIEQLQEDGRRPYAAIGKAVGLSEAAVRQRVQRQAMIGIRCEGDVEAVADKVADMAEVDYVVITAGAFDLMVEVVCEDDDHLLELVSKRIRAVPSVRSTESFVYLKLRKQLYNWGTR